MGNQMHGYCEIRGFMSTYHDILWIFSAYKLVNARHSDIRYRKVTSAHRKYALFVSVTDNLH